MVTDQTRKALPGVMTRGAHRLVMALGLLAALTYARLAASAQFPHLILAGGYATGPDGNTSQPSARVGDPVVVRVSVQNYCDDLDSVTVQQISVIIHHARGDVTIPNLITEPVLLPLFGDRMEVSRTFSAGCDDPEVLTIDCFVVCIDNRNGLGFPGIPRPQYSQFGCQVRIIPEPPQLTVQPASPGAIRVNWAAPTATECFQLESCTAWGAPWTPAEGQLVLDEASHGMLIDTTRSPAQFFRLSRK